MSVSLESPIASNSKTGNSMHNKPLPESVPSNIAQPVEQNSLQTRPPLEATKNEPEAGSSSLATAKLIIQEPIATPAPGSSQDKGAKIDKVPSTLSFSSSAGNLASGSLKDSSTYHTNQGNNAKDINTQPTVPTLIIPAPPLIIPVPQTPTKLAAKPAPKPRAAPKSTRKKSAEDPKPEPRPKASRAKKVTQAAGNEPVVSKPEPKTQPITTSPNKRKSRSASNESAPVVIPTPPATTTPASTPTPAKRQRKKRADPPPTTSKPTEQPQSASSNLSYSISAGYDHLSTPSLSRSSLSRLFTSSLADNNQPSSADDPAKAFEELRENTWTHLSKCILEQAQQFDIPSLIGTLYTLRSENEKLVNKVRDLTVKKEQLVAMNARLDLPGPMLTQHLNSTSPNFSSVVSGLTNCPINKQPLVSVAFYNHVSPGSLGPPGYLDRSSPLVGQSCINNIKSSSISTPSPPIGALMAHSNRAGLITVNPPMNSLAQLGANPPGSLYHPRQ